MPQRILSKIPFLKNRLDAHMLEIMGGATIAFALKITGAVLAFVFNVLLARFLGAEGAGLYFLVLMVASIASIFGLAGLDNTLLRFVASNAALNDWVSVKGVYKKGVALVLAASIFSAVIIFSTAPLIANVVFSKPELAWPIRLMSLSIAPFALLTIYGEMLKGLKRILYASILQGVGVQALSVIGIYLVGRSMGVEGAILTYITATATTCVAGFWLWRVAARRTKGVTGYFATGELLRSSLPLFWVSVMNLVLSMAATFMLGMWGTKTEVGIFGVASRTAFLISFLLVAANSITAPKFAEFYRLGDIEALGSTARSSAKLLTLLALPVLLLILLFPASVMSLFGNQFREGGVVLSILAAGQFVNVATGSVGYLLMMSGNERVLMNNLTYIAILTLILNLLMIPAFGLTGAAIATAISVAAQNLSASYLVYRKLNIVPIPWFFLKKQA